MNQIPSLTTRSRSLRALRVAAASAVLAGAFTSAARADEPAAAPTTQELLDQIRLLQQQVEAMKRADAPASAPAAPVAESADALGAVLEDARARAGATPVMLMQEDAAPFVAGHNGKFILASPDGDFTLNPNFQLQLRYVANLRGEDGDSFDDLDTGFEIRRTKVGFKGNAFGPDLKYDIKFAFSRDGGDATLENAFIDYAPDELFGQSNVGLRAGQFKDITFFEETVSSSKQLAVDRSIVNESIGGGNTDFIQAAGPTFSGEKWEAMLLYTDGANTDNTPWADVNWEYGVAGRLDITAMGDPDAVSGDFTALGAEENSARVGAGFHFAGIGDSRTLWHTVDAQYETEQGLGLFAAYFGRWGESDGEDAFDIGGLLQASQMVGEDWEVFGRYGFIIFENDVVLGEGEDAEDFFHEITAGVNRYWNKHNLKLTIDAVYLPNGNPGSNSGIGLRSSDGEFDDQVAIRGQIQLLL